MAASAEEQLAALTQQMQTVMTANAELTAEVRRLGEAARVAAAFGPAAAAANAAQAGETEATRSGHSFAKTPQFHYGKQCCPEPFTGKNKGGFKDYAFRMSNFLAMSLVCFRHVGSVHEWAEKEKAPVTVDEFKATADISYWKGAGCDHLEFSASLWVLLSNKTEGEALNCIRTVEKGNGVEAWRKLHAEYRPSTATQAMGYMTRILTQVRAKDVEHAMAALNTVEENVRCYEECGPTYHLEDFVKSAGVHRFEVPSGSRLPRQAPLRR